MTTLDTIGVVAAAQAELHRDRVALVCGERRVTYAQLDEASNRTANALAAAGLPPGARVAYLGKDTEHLYELLVACAKAGTVLVPLNWRLAPAELAHILRDSGAQALFAEPDALDAASGPVAELAAPAAVVPVDAFSAWRDGHSATPPERLAGPDDPVLQIYTSGTTGLPKGVVLRQGSFFAVRDLMAAHGLDWIDWREDDRNLLSLPGYHIGGPWWFLQGLRGGATNVVLRSFVAKEVLGLISGSGITTAILVPAMLTMLLDEPGASAADFATLRKVVYGGSPIAEPLLRRCLDVMGCEFAQIYGLTETCASAVCLPPADHVPGSPRLAAAGRPYPGVELKVIDSNGDPLPAGAVGEVCVSTPAAMLEYWRLPEATARTMGDGWVRTGDAGCLDEDGYLYIRDRIKDMVIVAGENIYPAEIEHALVWHPAVAEVAVVGVPDERWGERLQAFVVPEPGQRVRPRELVLWLKERIASFKIPTRYEFVDALPRNASGKVLRRTLREQAAPPPATAPVTNGAAPPELSELPELPEPRPKVCPFGPAPETATLRETTPVVKVRCPTGMIAWLVTRYADAREVLGDPNRFSSRAGQAGHLLKHMKPDAPVGEGHWTRMDGAEYQRFRRIMSPEVSMPRRMEQLRPLIGGIVDQYIDDLATQPQPVDLYGQFAMPVTTLAIAELLGVPSADRELFLTASQAMFAPATGDDDIQRATRPLFEYVHRLIQARRGAPGEDALSRMIVRGDATPQPFTDLELVMMGAGLLISGFDTTASTIAYGLLALLEHPAELDRLRADPDLVPSAAEEVVRFLGGSTGILRQVSEDTRIGDQPVVAGDYVVVAIQAADRDPEVFPDPDRLDIGRPASAHLGFGHGPHQCIGQQLARLQIGVTLRALIRRIPTMRLAVPLDQVPFKAGTAVHGPASVPVVWSEVLPRDAD